MIVDHCETILETSLKSVRTALYTWEAKADNLVPALLMAGRCHHLRQQAASMLHRASHRDLAANVSQSALPPSAFSSALSVSGYSKKLQDDFGVAKFAWVNCQR